MYRQYKLKVNGRRFNVDGYDPLTKTIYEFFGDYYHGNPKVFKQNDMNKRAKKTFGELYQKTMNKINFLKDNGYNVKYVWETSI